MCVQMTLINLITDFGCWWELAQQYHKHERERDKRDFPNERVTVRQDQIQDIRTAEGSISWEILLVRDRYEFSRPKQELGIGGERERNFHAHHQWKGFGFLFYLIIGFILMGDIIQQRLFILKIIKKRTLNIPQKNVEVEWDVCIFKGFSQLSEESQ